MSDFLSETLSHNRKSERIPFDTGSGWQGLRIGAKYRGKCTPKRMNWRERRIHWAGATEWPRRASNLPLAACPRVGHIGPAGDVAEWLKAAVC
jgi:hypothetical protein